jgi:plasmid stabilization system protein ParE
MDVEVVCAPDALHDLDAIWEWIAVENGESGSAERVVADILERIDELASFPLLSTPLDARCSIKSDWHFVESR